MRNGKNRIVIFGMGSISKLLTESVNETTEVVAYIADGVEGSINGIPIIPLNDISKVDFDYVVVAFGNSIKGIEVLSSVGIPESKIVGYAYSGLNYKDSILQNELDDLIAKCVKNEKIPYLFNLNSKSYYACGMNALHRDEIIEKDFVREQTLFMLGKEIYRRCIDGAVAEIGVSSGDFACKINKVFHDRMLYLYDTFEGIPNDDKEHALDLGWGERLYAINEEVPEVDDVLKKMHNPNNCIIRKGIFPESFDCDETFAFVSLDIDFYDSTRVGLERIYSSLAEGGYIMVHDYYNIMFLESRQAIMDFCDKSNISIIPIPDNGGSAIITKQGDCYAEY